MLTITNVDKEYGSTKALADVSLTIPTGSCFGLVGPNGAGKSTLMKLITTVIEDFKGEITYNNERLTNKMKQGIGYVPQEICVEQQVSAKHNLAFFGKLYQLRGKALSQRIDEVLTYVGLHEKGDDLVHTFSGGMKRRLNIGCALMHNPALIIMDEPTVGIDPQSRKYIFQMMEQLTASGRTIIYASHYMEEVEQLCDRVAFIDHGKIVEEGSVSDVLHTHSVPSIFIKGNNFPPTVLEKYGQVRKKDEGYVLTTADPLQAMERTIQYCRTNALALERLEMIQPRLEDVFFSLTGSHLRDQS